MHTPNQKIKVPENLKDRAVNGVLWTGASKFLTQALLILVTVILARLLSPDDFGLVGMAAIITVAVAMVNDRGLGTAIIQKKDIQETHLSSIFWTSIVFGLLLFAISSASGGLFALFFKNNLVSSIITFMALGFVIGGFGIVHKALLFRQLKFKTLAIIEICALFGYGLVAITMALSGFGVWSLVWSALLKDAIIVILLWLMKKWRPRLLFHWSSLRQVLGFSANVLGTDIMLYVNSNVDYLLIGRLLGAAPLGFYSLALNMVKMPVQRLSGVVSKVAFPAFAAVQDDLVRFRSGFLKSILFISFVTFPLLVGLMILAPELVAVLMGVKWLPMVLPLQILCPVGILKSVGTTRGAVLTACGRADIEFRWNLAYLLPLVAVIYFGAQFGLVGVAIGFTTLYVITFPIIQAITNAQIKLSAGEYILALLPAAVASSAMAVCVLAIRWLVHDIFGLGNEAVLISGILIGIASYFMVLFKLRKETVKELLVLLSRKKQIVP